MQEICNFQPKLSKYAILMNGPKYAISYEKCILHMIQSFESHKAKWLNDKLYAERQTKGTKAKAKGKKKSQAQKKPQKLQHTTFQ